MCGLRVLAGSGCEGVTGNGVGVVCMLELWHLYVYVNLWLALMKFARCLEPVVERVW
jgi:hypothetical protein